MISRATRVPFVALLVSLATSIGFAANSTAPLSDGSKGPLLLESTARDLAITEMVLQRHRTGVDGSALQPIRGDDPGIVRRAESTLRLAALLRSRWNVTVDNAALQKEFARMRRDTVRPKWLEEMIEALDRDERRVAQALVAPALVNRLAYDHFSAENPADSDWSEFIAKNAPSVNEGIGLAATWRVDLGADEATARTNAGVDAPPTPGWRSGGLLKDAESDGRGGWDGTEYLIWGGAAPWIYNPATDSWRVGSTFNQPPPSYGPAVQVAGRKLFVWGGHDPSRQLNPIFSGGLYDPVSDEWTTISTSGPDTVGAATVWTGTQVIGWAGLKLRQGTYSDCQCFILQSTGSGFWSYTPATNTWVLDLPLPPVFIGTYGSIAWTGTEVLMWGGMSNTISQCSIMFPESLSDTGAAFNPTTRTWRPISSASGMQARQQQSSAWTGTEWVIWGGVAYSNQLYDGAIYNLASDTWRPIPASGAPRLTSPIALWTGAEVLIRGTDDLGNKEAGSRLNPSTVSWTPMATPSFSTGRHVAWFGSDAFFADRTHGGRYNPSTDTWSEVKTQASTIPGRNGGATRLSGTDLFVWGGEESFQTPTNRGYRFNLVTASWTPMSTTNAPAPRRLVNSAWTGTEFLVQGGSSAAAGGLYNPVTDSWRPMSTLNEPQGGALDGGIWSGSEFISWNSVGARYRVATDQWFPMSNTGAPTGAAWVVWTGSRMMAWKSGSNCPPPTDVPGSGAFYDPVTDTWAPVANDADTSERSSGVWTGQKVVRLGGVHPIYNGIACDRMWSYPTAVRIYNPTSDAWSTSPATVYGADGAVHVWDGAGIYREGGFLSENWCTDKFGYVISRRIDLRTDRQRLELVTGVTSSIPYPSPLGQPLPRLFWTGQDELHFDPAAGSGAFYNNADPDPSTDADGDGYPRSTDCNDSDATTHPGAAELCDQRDNDCDGTVDEGAGLDADSDGHFSCTEDCNDGNPSIYVGAPELCDNLDNDCDATVDENAGVDADNDGHTNCHDDCNDSNPTVYVNAPELCDLLDNDCDGSVDEGAGVDNDADGHFSCGDDCNDSNANVWKKPTFIPSLRVAGKPTTIISWDDMKPAWGTASVYDVLRGRLSQLKSAISFSQASCIANNRPTNSVADATAAPLGDSLYYLTRGQNLCGTGTYGTVLSDTTGAACP